MKRILITLIGIVFAITSVFGQTFIGTNKKEIIDDVKKDAISIGKPEKSGDAGYYSITIKFNNNTNMYSFTKDDICYFYMVIEVYTVDKYNYKLGLYDQKYLRINDDRSINKFDNSVTAWKESVGDDFIYRWIVVNYNKGVMYTIYLSKNNYDNNKYSYLQSLLGGN